MISWLFGNLFLWLALAALSIGGIGYVVSYFVSYTPMLKAHGLVMRVVCLLLIISGGYYVADRGGYERRIAEDKAEIERLNAEARAKEAQLDKQKQATNVALRKAKDAITKKQSDINSRIDSGELRLPTTCSVQASPSASSPGGSADDGSDTSRQAIKDIVQIASEGDRAITQLNACISTYNQVREAVNVKP